jgi:hypothetical protein
MRLPLTEEQAEALDQGDGAPIKAANPLDIVFGMPVCERCELLRSASPYSCPGEPVSYTLDGTPQFR